MNYIDISPIKLLLDEDFDALFDIQLREGDKQFDYYDDDGFETDEIDQSPKRRIIDSDSEDNSSPGSKRVIKQSGGPIKWKVANSIFKDYKRDTDHTLKL